MLSIAFHFLSFGSFIALMILVWRVSERPRWRVRAVVYGWGAVILWAFFWAVLMPTWFRGVMDAHTLVATFPDGTIAAAALLGGWFWPLILVALRSNRNRASRKKKVDEHLA